MSNLINETIFSGRNNSFTVEYAGVTFPTPTRIEFTLNGTTVNSVDNPAYFVSTLETDGRIEFKLGAAGYVAADSGKATVTVFDGVNTLGVIYSDVNASTKIGVTVV